jgi:hypothetical protein
MRRSGLRSPPAPPLRHIKRLIAHCVLIARRCAALSCDEERDRKLTPHVGNPTVETLSPNLLPNPETAGDSRGPDFARIQQVIDPLNLDLGFESLSLRQILPTRSQPRPARLGRRIHAQPEPRRACRVLFRDRERGSADYEMVAVLLLVPAKRVSGMAVVYQVFANSASQVTRSRPRCYARCESSRSQ